ncbi:MAG: hypothetical protein ACEPOV_13660 [Hyphomicrobiales bacterium]
MKRNYLLFLIAFLANISFAQMPEKISYQAVLRDADGKIIGEKEIGLEFSIFKDSHDGVLVYKETQVISTNKNGMLTAEIGKGVTSYNFETIEWHSGRFFINTKIDLKGGANYTLQLTSEIMAVPFAFHAKHAKIAETVEEVPAELPDQTNNSGKVLGTDGSSPSWVDVSFTNLTNIPTGLSDGDDNTQLSNSEVLTIVANDGYIKSAPDELPTQTGNAGKFLTTDGSGTVSWSTPTDTKLSDSEVLTIVANDGYIKSAPDELPTQTGNAGKFLTTDGSGTVSWSTVADELPDQTSNSGKVLGTDGSSASWVDVSFANLTNIPTGLSDGDDNTQLSNSEVLTIVANDGYIKSAPDELPTQTGHSGKFLTTDGSGTVSWSTPTDTKLSDSEVLTIVANDGYIKSAPDELPTQTGHSGKFLTTDGSGTVSWSTPTDTKLSDSEVLTIVANDGYIKSAPDELPTQTGHSGKFLTTDGSGTVSWSTVADELPDQTTSSGKILSTDGTNALWIDNNDNDSTNELELPASPSSGDIIYYNGTSWVSLPKGQDGQVLMLDSSVPSWKDSEDISTVTGSSMTITNSNNIVFVIPTTNNATLTLPNSPPNGKKIVLIKAEEHQNTVVITAGSGQVLRENGSESSTIDWTGETATLIYYSSKDTWFVY